MKAIMALAQIKHLQSDKQVGIVTEFWSPEEPLYSPFLVCE